MKPMFGFFQQEIKFDFLFLAIVKGFYWFLSNIFDKLASSL